MLVKNPVLTAVAVVSLAVGIPVGLAPLHVMDALTEAPLPVDDGDRIRSVRYYRHGGTAGSTRAFDYRVAREGLTTFQELAAFRRVERNLDPGSGIGAPVAAAEVTASAFTVLRSSPVLGRVLDSRDEAVGAPRVAVLGHDVWRSRLAGDSAAVGRIVRIGGEAHVVVGVMPPDFLFPAEEQLWLPLPERPGAEPGEGPPLEIFGRLPEGATDDAAQAELTALGGRLTASFPERYVRLQAEVVPFGIDFFGFPKGGLAEIWIFQWMALVLLGVACVNVGLLIFARTATRSKELAVRTALGASRRRIVAQVFTETLVLALVATGLGLLLLDLLPNRLLDAMWSPEWGGVPWWIDLGLTPAAVVQALLLAVFSATLASLLPAIRVTGKAVQQNIQRSEAGGYGIRFGAISTTLVVADVVFAVAAIGLVAAVGDRMANITGHGRMAGLSPEHVLAVELELPEESFAGDGDTLAVVAWRARLAAIQDELVGRLAAEPGVRGVAVADRLPRMDHDGWHVEVEGASPGEDRFGSYDIDRARVDPGFFDGLDQPIVAGRGFGEGDLEGDRGTVIVNTTFVERILGGRNPVGRRLRHLAANGEPGPWFEIGVVPDLAMNLAEPESPGGVYHPAAPGEIHPLRLAVHVGPDPGAFTPRLRELAHQVEPTAIVAPPTPLDRVFPEDWYLMVGLAIGWGLFVAVLLGLAASGIYAIMAFAVAQRTREIGIRAALGAGRAQVVATVGRRAATQLLAGVALGMPLAAWIYRYIREAPTPPGTAVLVTVVPGLAVVVLVGLAACTVPLLRALRIEPTEAMRGAG